MTAQKQALQGLRHTVLELWEHGHWFARQIWDQFLAYDCLGRASSLTYTTLFAVVPMMTVTYAMFSVIPEFSSVEAKIQNFVFQNFVPDSSSMVQEKLAEFSSRAKNLTAIGFVFLFVTAFMMLVTIERAFNTIWKVREPRRGFQRFLLYWGVLSLGPPLMAGGAFISIYLLSLPLVSDFDTFGIGEVLLGYVPVLFSIATFTVLFYAVPNTRVPFRHALLGGIFTMFAFETAKDVLPLVVRNSTMNAVYGTFAAVPLFLAWLWLVWVIVLAGATFVRTLSLERGHRDRAPEPAVIKCARILQLLYDAHQDGRGLDDQDIRRAVPLKAEEHDRIFEVLEGQRLIQRSDQDEWLLGRSLKTVSLWDLYKGLPEGLSVDRLEKVDGMEHIVGPLRSLAQFGSNEMSVSLDQLFAGATR